MSKQPHDWTMRDLPPCWNDCSSPTICISTGSCRCVSAECPETRPNPFLHDSPFSPFAAQNAQAKNSKPKSALGKLGGYPTTLIDDVARANWFDLVPSSSRAYLSKNANFPKIHLVDDFPGQAEMDSAPCQKLQKQHCFSADNIMYRAMKHLSVPPAEAEIIVLPVYQPCQGTEFLLHDLMAHAGEKVPEIKTGEKKVALVLTHDWGICIAFAW